MKRIIVNIVDLRKEPNHRSERVSQALFGTEVQELAPAGDWRLIQTPDGYRGFVEGHRIASWNPNERDNEWKISVPIVPVQEERTNGIITRLTLDTRFAARPEADSLLIPLPSGVVGRIPRAAAVPAEKRMPGEELIRLGLTLVGTPYLWGGGSPFGFDCSGFIQRLFHFCFNVWLPRDTAEQREQGVPVPLDELRPGDLCFFPGHVGLYIGGGRLLHSNRHHNGISLDRLFPPSTSYARELQSKLERIRRISPDSGG